MNEMTLCNVRPGESCWVVRKSAPHPPRYVESAAFVSEYGNVKLVAFGETWNCAEVFATEAEALESAKSSARWQLDYHTAAADDARRALAELGEPQ